MIVCSRLYSFPGNGNVIFPFILRKLYRLSRFQHNVELFLTIQRYLCPPISSQLKFKVIILWQMLNSYYTFRSGGCHGEGDIRKVAYFESSIEPEIAAGRV